MEKMFISIESSAGDTARSLFGDSEPARSRAGIASYRCKVLQARLEQGAASQHIAPLLSSQEKKRAEQARA